MKKYFYILLFWFYLFGQVKAQCNLVPNSGFETDIFVPCGGFGTSINGGSAPPWDSPTSGSPDLFNSCVSGMPSIGIPVNSFGFQNTHSGNGYAGLLTYSFSSNNWREYIQVALDSALVNNTSYCVNFFVNPTNRTGFCNNNIGIYFSTTQTSILSNQTLNFTPQINYTTIISDTANWTEISGTYIAQGGERYIIIGNFYSDTLTDTIAIPTTLLSWNNRFAYYYLDDVDVHKCTCNVGVKEESKSAETTIYPNPFTTETTITFGEEQKNTTIKITDLLGKEIKTINFTGKQLVIDKGVMQAGIYFVQTTDEKKNLTNKKIIIQ